MTGLAVRTPSAAADFVASPIASRRSTADCGSGAPAAAVLASERRSHSSTDRRRQRSAPGKELWVCCARQTSMSGSSARCHVFALAAAVNAACEGKLLAGTYKMVKDARTASLNELRTRIDRFVCGRVGGIRTIRYARVSTAGRGREAG